MDVCFRVSTEGTCLTPLLGIPLESAKKSVVGVTCSLFSLIWSHPTSFWHLIPGGNWLWLACNSLTGHCISWLEDYFIPAVVRFCPAPSAILLIRGGYLLWQIIPKSLWFNKQRFIPPPHWSELVGGLGFIQLLASPSSSLGRPPSPKALESSSVSPASEEVNLDTLLID